MSRTQPSSPRESSQLFSQVQDAKYDSTVQESLNFSVLRDQPTARSRRMVTRSMASRYPQFPREMTTPARRKVVTSNHTSRQQASSIRASRPADSVLQHWLPEMPGKWNGPAQNWGSFSENEVVCAEFQPLVCCTTCDQFVVAFSATLWEQDSIFKICKLNLESWFHRVTLQATKNGMTSK